MSENNDIRDSKNLIEQVRNAINNFEKFAAELDIDKNLTLSIWNKVSQSKTK